MLTVVFLFIFDFRKKPIKHFCKLLSYALLYFIV